MSYPNLRRRLLILLTQNEGAAGSCTSLGGSVDSGGGDRLIDKERNMGNVSAGGFAFAGTSS